MGVVQQTLDELHVYHSRRADRVTASGSIDVCFCFHRDHVTTYYTNYRMTELEHERQITFKLQ